jgi:hypothetical protein
MTKIILNLLDNGIDYIFEAIKPINTVNKIPFALNPTSKRLKYCVLNLYSGIELLLKEKLRQEHWSLIFHDINKATLTKLKNGDFASVSYEHLILRLKNIVEVEFNEEPIKNLKSLRNKFEHFEVDTSLSECQHIIAAALDEVIEFWGAYLKESSEPQQKRKVKIIKRVAIEFDVYREHRLNKFKQIINKFLKDKDGLIVLCLDCSSLSFAVFKDDSKVCNCFVCNKKYNKYEYLKNKRKSEKNDEKLSSLTGDKSYEPYDTICPSCQQETRVRYVISNETSLYCCLNCLKEEEQSIKKKTDPKFKEELKNFTWREASKRWMDINTVEETYQIIQDSKKTDINLDGDK